MADPQQDRLDELEAEIQEAKKKAEEHGNLPDEEHHQTFADPEGDGTDNPFVSPPPG